MMTKGQQLMLEDGCPAFLFIGAAERRAAWEKNPPKLVTFSDPRLEASLQMRAEEKKIKTATRIAKLLRSKESTKGKRWNMKFCRWELQEDSMSGKLVIHAYDKNGKVITRCKGTMPASATAEQIEARVKSIIARGKTVQSISFTKPTGGMASAWELKNGVPIQNDGLYKDPSVQPEVTTTAPADNKANPVETEEVTMRKSSKARNGNGKSRHKADNGIRPGSKLEIIANLLKRKAGCTEREAAKAVGWARVSMSMRARDCGLKIRTEKGEDGVTRYYGV